MATAYASKTEPAKLSGIIGMADAINHAIPTQWELQRTLGRLKYLNLVSKKGKKYELTGAGKDLMENVSTQKPHTVFGVLERLSVHLPDGGDIYRDEDVTSEEAFRAQREYLGRLGVPSKN